MEFIGSMQTLNVYCKGSGIQCRLGKFLEMRIYGNVHNYDHGLLSKIM